MKKLLVLGMFSLASALASNTGPANLRGMHFCYAREQMQVDSVAKTAFPDLQQRLVEDIFTKLTAYRVPMYLVCSKNPTGLWIQVDTVKAASGIIVYSLSLNIYDSSLKPGMVSVYSAGTFGTTYSTGEAFARLVSDAIGRMVDKLAADYALANP